MNPLVPLVVYDIDDGCYVGFNIEGEEICRDKDLHRFLLLFEEALNE